MTRTAPVIKNQIAKERRLKATSVWMALAALLSAGYAEAYDPPAGIPEPTFGIDEVAPADPASWASDTPGFYYVQAGGTNIGNGFPNDPRGTLPTNLSAGDKVVLSGSNGPIALDATTISAGGTLTAPVFVTGINAAEIVSENGAVARERLSFAGQYFIVENVLFRAIPLSTSNASFLSIRNCEITEYSPGSNSSAVGFGGSDNVLFQNHIHNNGDSEGSQEADIHGVKVTTGANRVWVLDSHMHNNGGDSVQVGSASTSGTWPQFVYIGGNESHGDRENAFDIKQSRDVVMSENLVYDYVVRNSSSGEGIVVHNDAERVWVLFNEVYDVNIGIISTGAAGFYVIGNTVRDITNNTDPDSLFGSMAIHSRGSSDTYVVGNTLYNVNKGVALASGGSSIVISQNIFSGLSTSSFHVALLSTGAISNSSIHENLYGDPPRIRISGTIYGDLDSFRGAFAGQGIGSLQGDPRFQAPAVGNFQLAADSPGIDAGSRNTIYSVFSTLYGFSIDVDAAGVSRPLGSAFDMGAFEAPGAALVRPSPVQGVTAIPD